MDFKHTLKETLEARFDDVEEMNDIVNHGIQCGYHGFIYTYDINEFFNEFENEIEDYYYEIFGDSWLKESGAADKGSMNEIRAHLVWGLAEMYCADKLDQLLNV